MRFVKNSAVLGLSKSNRYQPTNAHYFQEQTDAILVNKCVYKLQYPFIYVISHNYNSIVF